MVPAEEMPETLKSNPQAGISHVISVLFRMIPCHGQFQAILIILFSWLFSRPLPPVRCQQLDAVYFYSFNFFFSFSFMAIRFLQCALCRPERIPHFRRNLLNVSEVKLQFLMRLSEIIEGQHSVLVNVHEYRWCSNSGTEMESAWSKFQTYWILRLQLFRKRANCLLI